MVKLIEDQMHEVAKEREEERCRKLEEEYKLDPDRKNKKATRRKIEKPWTRGVFPKLCQETDWLVEVREFNYELENEGFQVYCRSRGVLHSAGNPGSTRWEFCVHYDRGPDEYFDAVGRQPPQPEDPDSDPPRPEMDTDWKIVRIARGKLQDCWELFSGDR